MVEVIDRRIRRLCFSENSGRSFRDTVDGLVVNKKNVSWSCHFPSGLSFLLAPGKTRKFKLESKKRHSWTTACHNTANKSCDLSGCGIHYLGVYMLRVRANANVNYSDWVLKEFCPDKHAAIGPPSKVDVDSDGSSVCVYISDPLTSSNGSMKDEIPKLYYNILYWECNVDKQVLKPHVLNSSVSMVTLPNLKSWTRYCVRVQSRYDLYNKSSEFTLPHCIQTEGTIPWWQTFLYSLGSLVMVFVVVLPFFYILLKIFNTLKAAFYPMIQFPPFFQEYLHDSFGSDTPCLLSLGSEEELCCDKVTIYAKPLEFHCLSSEGTTVLTSGLEPDSSGRCSHQDKRRSKDSGVYATESSCSQQQPNRSQTSTGAKIKSPIQPVTNPPPMQEEPEFPSHPDLPPVAGGQVPRNPPPGSSRPPGVAHKPHPQPCRTSPRAACTLPVLLGGTTQVPGNSH
ncbi:interleukin-10 receptor subunit beta isoform X2 [Dunckerocampus dactyliophorus]|uniref:interleukin-10 receptor subunit beta isoform X2 n=1 Tax=Dunckerocampus dactyliophorus TaxID=161453 RepID=UPI0024051824|nr:interleukin-10 receptor subunit beta isoform X2 [Dunckerocampus dactyliophorus]